MPINSNERQNTNFSQEKPVSRQTHDIKRPTVKKVNRTKQAPNSKVK